MQAQKQAFALDVVNIVRDMCKTVFNLQNDQDLGRVFGISHEQLEKVICNVVDSLPDALFENTNPGVLEEMKYVCAREYIFFQIQENYNDPRYQEDLRKFIHIFSRDIRRRFVIRDNYHLSLREEK